MSAICGNVYPVAPEMAIHSRAKGPGGRTKSERSPVSMNQYWGHPACCGDRAYSAGSGFEYLQALEEGTEDELSEPE